MAEVIERLPGPPYAYLEIHAKDARELAAIKDELKETHPEYFNGEQEVDEEQAFEDLKEALGATEDPQSEWLRRNSGTS